MLRYDGRLYPLSLPHIVPARPCYHGRVSGAKLTALITVFFFTSVISVVTGSTSLITVPVMIALGIEAHVAVATNMLALTFMSRSSVGAFSAAAACRRRSLSRSSVLAWARYCCSVSRSRPCKSPSPWR